jgi:ketosteroid isomerase-like protein
MFSACTRGINPRSMTVPVLHGVSREQLTSWRERAMTLSRAAAAAGALLIGVAACQTRTAEFTNQDEATLRAMFDSTPRYLVAGDFSKWASQFSENSVLQPPNTRSVKGRQNLVPWAKTMPPLEDLTFTNVQVSGEGNVAYGTSDYVLKPKGLPADSGKQLVIFRRPANGDWEIAAGSFNSDIPLPPSTAMKK